ncbi:CLIP-associating protein [Aphelenchoides besseyi]|nr:CLIP-associating protein [Aphelenchoides besseyi]
MTGIAKKEAGAVTRDDFEKSFENAPQPIEPFTHKYVEKRLSNYIEMSKDVDRDYRLFNKILVEIRSVIKHEGSNARDLLLSWGVLLNEVLLLAIKDKRSAVVHEGCFTAAMVVKTFGHDMLNFAVEALAVLIPYSQNSIRVVSSGAMIAAGYICQNIKSQKIFTLLLEFMKTSKSRFVRGAVMELVREIAESWTADVLKKNANKIRELTDLGIVDAGPPAREATRDALTILSKKIPDSFQPPQLSRSASRTRNFFDTRAATDMSSRMLSAKRVIAPEKTMTLRTKPNQGHAPTLGMRSRTPTATSTRANSQPGSRQGSPPGRNNFAIPTAKSPVSRQNSPGRNGQSSAKNFVRANATPSAAQTRRQNTIDFKPVPVTPPRLTPKRSPAPRPNVVPAHEAYAMAQMNRENIRNFNEHEIKTNGLQKSFDATDNILSKSTPTVQTSWKTRTTADLAGNNREQCLYLNAVLDAISLTDHKEVLKEAEPALNELAGIIHSGVIVVWDTYFNPLFAKIVDLITENVDTKARCAALKCLKELTSRSHSMSAKVTMLVNRLIDVQLANNDLALVKAIEDCTTSLAKNVPIDVLLPVLKNIIRAPEQPQQKCAAAVKIISHAILNLSEADTRNLVETVVPMVFCMYEKASESAVRRDCVICLVVFANKVTMPVIRPHITTTMEKLIDVYGKRPTMVNWR